MYVYDIKPEKNRFLELIKEDADAASRISILMDHFQDIKVTFEILRKHLKLSYNIRMIIMYQRNYL